MLIKLVRPSSQTTGWQDWKVGGSQLLSLAGFLSCVKLSSPLNCYQELHVDTIPAFFSIIQSSTEAHFRDLFLYLL